MTEKKFKDIHRGEHIYILRPFTHLIYEAEVKASAPHPKSKAGMHIIEFYIPFKNDKIGMELLKESEKFFAKTAAQAFVPGNETMCTLMTKPAPTIIATSKHQIDQWLKTATPSDISNYLMMKTRKL